MNSYILQSKNVLKLIPSLSAEISIQLNISHWTLIRVYFFVVFLEHSVTLFTIKKFDMHHHWHLYEVSYTLVIFLFTSVSSIVPRIGSCPTIQSPIFPIGALVKFLERKRIHRMKSERILTSLISFDYLTISKDSISSYKSQQSSQVHCFLPVLHWTFMQTLRMHFHPT